MNGGKSNNLEKYIRLTVNILMKTKDKDTYKKEIKNKILPSGMEHSHKRR